MNETDKHNINKKNIDFFSKNYNYQKSVSQIDTYQILYNKITDKVKDANLLLDVGHGGSFDYDTSKVNKIVGLDLDEMIEKNSIPKNVKLEVGSALQIPEKLINFDIVLFVMLIHHLVGKNVSENFNISYKI